MQNYNQSNNEINEEFTCWLKGAFGATKKFFGKIGGKVAELVSDFKEDFKKIKSEQELKDKTIKILKDLSEETKKKISEVKEISEIQQHLDEFQDSIKKIMEEFEKMTESTFINENILLGAKSMFKVFGDYWTKFKKDYQVKLEELKKERDKIKALNEAKKSAKKLLSKIQLIRLEKQNQHLHLTNLKKLKSQMLVKIRQMINQRRVFLLLRILGQQDLKVTKIT